MLLSKESSATITLNNTNERLVAIQLPYQSSLIEKYLNIMKTKKPKTEYVFGFLQYHEDLAAPYE